MMINASLGPTDRLAAQPRVEPPRRPPGAVGNEQDRELVGHDQVREAVGLQPQWLEVFGRMRGGDVCGDLLQFRIDCAALSLQGASPLKGLVRHLSEPVCEIGIGEGRALRCATSGSDAS